MEGSYDTVSPYPLRTFADLWEASGEANHLGFFYLCPAGKYFTGLAECLASRSNNTAIQPPATVPSLRKPALSANPPVAVITAHGQPSAPAPAEADLARLAAAVAPHLPGWDVRSATLSTPGRLVSEAAGGALIYPFFMSRGFFTAKVLPGRLQGLDCRIADPFGLHAGLPALAAQAVVQAAAQQGWERQTLHLLLAAHGSARGPKAAEAAESFAARLRPLLAGCTVSLGYIEQPPSIETAARALPARSFCLPFFAQAGDHVKQDLPEALENAGFGGILLPVAGALPGVPELIAAGIRAAARGQGR